MSLARFVHGPEQSRRSTTLIALAGLILGGLAALLGTVTHSGGIDGGLTGIIVALMTVGLGAAAFALLAGMMGWVGFSIGFLATLGLSSAYSEGDAIGALSENLSMWWFNGTPAALIIGGFIAWVGCTLVDRE
ncbi:hypothetical protein [Flaviflexus equikiangi]|uniref:hypothetical protein n=1 Tax=Flaviflexus equikiangi TaxID=2758573 RepID=UPI0015F74AB6|nr:hypothetical protein [Flaviflexus equikiangi]